MDVLVPKENNNDDIVMISKLHKSPGDRVTEGDELIEFETSKTAFCLHAPASGHVDFLYGVGDEVAVNTVVCRILSDVEGESASVTRSENESPGTKEVDIVYSNKAKEIDTKNIDVSGHHWINTTVLQNLKEPPDGSKIKSFAVRDKDAAEASVNEERGIYPAGMPAFIEKKTTMRKRAEIENLGALGGGIYQSTIGIEIKAGARLIPSLVFDSSIQDLVCYEVSKMLSGEFADLNSFYISDNKLGSMSEVHAGISLDSKNKLIVSRIKNSDKLSLLETQDIIAEAFTKFEDDALKSEDFHPSTFTISDLSQTPASFMLPMLNGYEGLILGITKTMESAFSIFATFDHRVTEGLRISNFLNDLKRRIESHFNDGAVLACYFCGKSLNDELTLGHKGFLRINRDCGEVNSCRNCFEGV